MNKRIVLILLSLIGYIFLLAAFNFVLFNVADRKFGFWVVLSHLIVILLTSLLINFLAGRIKPFKCDKTMPATTPDNDSITVEFGNNNIFDGNIADIAGGDISKKPEITLKQILDSIRKQHFKLSLSYPKLLSKRFESPFLVQIYFEELSSIVKAKIKDIMGEGFSEHIYDTEFKLGQTIKAKIFSPDITFPEPIAKKLNSSVNAVTFLGKPLDTCYPGEHKVILSVLDNKTGIEYQSETFTVKVVDFAFDHISHPLLSRVSAVVLGIGTIAMFILTFLEQIDKTIGLTSGTAAGVVAAVAYANYYNLYQRTRPNMP